MNFLSRHKIALTPLSPIHIGCGEDFEPTRYVIDAEQKLLYGFDPSRAVLPEDVAQNLAACAVQANPLSNLHRRFFLGQHKETFISNADIVIAVEQDIVTEYGNRLTGDFNQFFIERHAHQAYGHQLPYVPGSALKGALRTGWLSRLLDADGQAAPVFGPTQPPRRDAASNMEVRLFREIRNKLHTSPFRLLKVSDLLPKPGTARALLSANYRYKDGLSHAKKLPPLIKESLLPWQYREMSGEIVLHNIPQTVNTNMLPVLRPQLRQIVKDCHSFHRNCWEEEMNTLCENRLVNVDWRNDIENILSSESFRSKLESGQAMLVRLGRYGGAESKTLPCAAHIKIHRDDYRKKTTTCWLAKVNGNLVPFGWAILEIDPQDDLPELKAWCKNEAENRPDMKAHYTALASLRQEAIAKAEQQKAEREASDVAQRLAEERGAEATAERRLASMSEAAREIKAFKDYFKDRVEVLRGRQERANGKDHLKASELAKKALENANWTADEKKAAADAIEEWLPKVVSVEMKNVCKKLKLTELKT